MDIGTKLVWKFSQHHLAGSTAVVVGRSAALGSRTSLRPHSTLLQLEVTRPDGVTYLSEQPLSFVRSNWKVRS